MPAYIVLGGIPGQSQYPDNYIKWSYFWYPKIVPRQTAHEFYRARHNETLLLKKGNYICRLLENDREA